MLARFFSLPLAAGLIALSGCGPARLDETKNYSLGAGEYRSIDPPSQPKAQTITVEFESTAADVDIGVFKESDAKEIESVQFSKAIKAETGKKKGTLTADVPENTAYRVILQARGKTDVKLHVTNGK